MTEAIEEQIEEIGKDISRKRRDLERARTKYQIMASQLLKMEKYITKTKDEIQELADLPLKIRAGAEKREEAIKLESNKSIFFSAFGELIVNYIDSSMTKTQLIKAIHNHDWNFDKLDRNTSTRKWNRADIKGLIEESIEHIKSADDRCSECARMILDSDWIIEYESREYWGETTQEKVVTGYQCSKCGYKEDC